MKEDGRSQERRRCLAMIEAGIEDPNSKDGIDLCLHCPYPSCIVFNNGRITTAAARRFKRIAEAKDMVAKGYSIAEIAQVMKINERTVGRYLVA